MKKFLVGLLAAAMVGSMGVTAMAEESTGVAIETVAEEKGITVIANDVEVVFADAKPFIDENSRVLVPLRAIGEALSLEVEWDGESRVATFIGGDKKVAFAIDSVEYEIVDGEDAQKAEMDTKAIISEERIYAPVRYLAEAFGFVVSWNGETKTVFINTPEPTDGAEEGNTEGRPEEKVDEKADDNKTANAGSDSEGSSKQKAKSGKSERNEKDDPHDAVGVAGRI